VHAADETSADKAAADIAANYRIADVRPEQSPIIVHRL
jgi:thymidine phosphorylase